MNFKPTRLPEVILIQLQMFKDNRGFSMETYRGNELQNASIYLPLVQQPLAL
jgi:dTDP-4-dehydrorhamnose 3,5-epimerase-like enzyme